MSRRKRAGREPAPGKWQYTVGEVPFRLTAFERPDKGFAIYTRVWDGQRYTSRRALCGPIRDKDGRIIPEKEVEAQQLAIRRQKEIAAGIHPDEVRPGPLTLAAGFRRLLDRKDGKYPTDTPHRRSVERSARIIQEILKRDLLWEHITHRHYRMLWRAIARRHIESGRKAFGLRAAEIICNDLQSASRWLQQEGLIEPGTALPAPGWKTALKTDWQAITGDAPKKPKKPRYTDAEAERLWRALPQADPRLELAMELGAELRLGQVLRVRRSDVHPSPDGRFRFGMVVVHGRGKKHGETVVLTRRQRHALTRAILWGYLALAEQAYRKGEIEDYFLIASGKLHRAKDHRGRDVQRVQVHMAKKHLGHRTLGRMWAELEHLAGVEHVPGRLWYGMRRLQADRAEALEGVQARVKNRIGGWTKTSTREEYLEQATIRDAIEAARVRELIRPQP